jgi:hypothetical protein
VLSRSGYDAEACRNVTPEYFYGRTTLRLVAIGGRIVVVDMQKISAADPLPSDERFTSVALGEGGIYVTSDSSDGSSLWKYETGVGETLVQRFSENQVGVFSDGEIVSVYEVKRLDSKKYISVYVRLGDPIAKFDNKENQ